MKTVYKYPLPVDDAVSVSMPKGASVLCVQVQHGQPCLWAIVDPEESEFVDVKFIIVGTGHPLPDDAGAHVGSFQLHGGALVFHLFWRL